MEYLQFHGYDDMSPISNQSGKICATTTTRKFDSLENITIQNLKFHPIISQIGSYTYNAAKVLTDYLRPLCQTEYKINDTQSIASQIKKQTPLDEDEEYVTVWILHSLTFLCKKPLTILSIKYTQKRNSDKSGVKHFSENYYSK